MSWLRLDDSYDMHPKLLELSEVERWRWTRALLYCARHRTRGLISRRALRELGLGRVTGRLVGLRLLVATEADDVLQVNDWDRFNPKDPTAADRQARWRASQRNGKVDADVDADVDARAVTVTRARALARARGPVPVPVPVPNALDVEGDSSVAVVAFAVEVPRASKGNNGNRIASDETATATMRVAS